MAAEYRLPYTAQEFEEKLDKLKDAGITFEKVDTMNTNSVKAFVLDELGQKGNPATITKEDLPKGLNFFQYDEMEVLV